MYTFTYSSPSAVSEAVAQAAAEDAKILAGGMTLLPTMKQRLAAPSALIDLRQVAELVGISKDGDAVVIGAMTRHADVADSEIVKSAIPALAELASLIGDPAVRNRGTIGGSIANNDPAADYPAAALEPGEIITAVSFPKAEKAAYMKFRNPASRYAIVGVFVAKTAGGARVAVTGAGSNGVFREVAMEAALDKDFSPTAIAGLKVDPSTLSGDMHADAEYRAHLIGVMAKRAIAAAG